jgi:hypothetical protein
MSGAVSADRRVLILGPSAEDWRRDGRPFVVGAAALDAAQGPAARARDCRRALAAA